jgi:hypothetical protein
MITDDEAEDANIVPANSRAASDAPNLSAAIPISDFETAASDCAQRFFWVKAFTTRRRSLETARLLEDILILLCHIHIAFQVV